MSNLKEKLNRYKKMDFDIDSYLLNNYIVGSKAIIPINISSKDEMFLLYDLENKIINPDIISYIESIVYYIPYEYSITLNITGVTFTDSEKAEIVKSLTNQFGLVVHDKKAELYFNDKKGVLLFIFGFVVLYFSFFLQKTIDSRFTSEIISIVGTFSIWEFVDTIWFDRNHYKVDVLNAGQVASANITFNE